MKQKNMILMVVAVGCGLVAALLTTTMSGKTPASDSVEVLVAASNLPVGTMFTKEDLPKYVKTKRINKDSVPAEYAKSMEDLLDKRLARSVRLDETFNPADLSKGGVITLPPGMHMVSLQISLAKAVAGFVGPGSRVDINATVTAGKTIRAFPLMVNMLIVAVDTQTTYTKDGTFPTLNTVSFAVDQKQALLLELAQKRHCDLSLMLRGQDTAGKPEEKYDINKVQKLLQDDDGLAKFYADSEEDGEKAKPVYTPGGTPTPTPAGKPETVPVLVATEDVAPGTVISSDLIADKFKTIDYPKGMAEKAVTDLKPYVGKTFKFGVPANQWVATSSIGDVPLKPSAQETAEVKKPPMDVDSPAHVAKGKTHDVTVHTSSGSKMFRYEESAPGEWKLKGEIPLTSKTGPEAPSEPAPTEKDKDKPNG